MVDLPPARKLLTTAPATCYDLVVLAYDERLLRRKRLTTVHDESFLVDLPTVTNLDDHWGFELDDGRTIHVVAAEEYLVQITGPDLLRYTWHIGNRHTPCQIEPARLLIRRDPVLETMLTGLGATLTHISEPFTPEGGAYGTGRTMGHDHGGHDHGPHTHTETFGWHDHGDGHPHYHPPADSGGGALPFGHKHAK
jgi:urease accessory protein